MLIYKGSQSRIIIFFVDIQGFKIGRIRHGTGQTWSSIDNLVDLFLQKLVQNVKSTSICQFNFQGPD